MPSNTPTKTFQLFFDTRFPFAFLLGALLLGVLGNMLSDLAKLWLERYFPGAEQETLRVLMIFGVAIAAMILLILLTYFARWVQAYGLSEVAYQIVDRPQPKSARGLVAFASLTETAHLEAALRYHEATLEKVWLLATDKTKEKAEEIKADFDSPTRSVVIVHLPDPFDLQVVRQTVEHVYATYLGKISETEVIADFTGGTKPMTVGMIFACLSATRRLQYVVGHYEQGDIKALHPVEYGIDYAMVAPRQLNGQTSAREERR